MHRVVLLVAGWLAVTAPVTAQVPLPKPLVTDLKNVSNVTIGPDGNIYLSERGFEKDNPKGRLLVVKKGKAEPFVAELENPTGLVAWQKWLYVAEKRGIVR